MENLTRTEVLLQDGARRERQKERLYVFCQAFGWGAFLVLQLVFSFVFATTSEAGDPWRTVAITVMVVALGVLLTHAARVVMKRWGWKQLGWRALVPRVLLFSFLLSVAWTAIGYGYTYGALQLPWESKHSVWLFCTISVINGTVLIVGWMCVYFIYQLFDRFNRSEIERLQLMATVKDAELRALKSQVNPHFIFNALNSLRALIDEDPARARLAVTQLANLLRYSLQSAQCESVPFEDELRVVNDYLALEQVRHEERLRVRLDVAPETLGLSFPPLLLQTLVENAVKYGISPRPEGGEILIEAACAGGQLRLRVTNPGELRPAGAGGTTGGSTGLGLRNAAERLRLFFGEKASLRLRADDAAQVVAEVILPSQISRA
ncbi:histidine kinase [Horticoccus luteus]|uniref:Histidine kinase n=1 Tax=Horticoccus luteus TaxID=2862869 RepID=A0A8F9XKM2_9BACT|nr:histidine kinase [Horticoccus luteus]QYM78204.1 histidine kinase [Horticoccus luteus]